MNFVKGAMLGIVAGTIVGVMNSETISYAFKKGTKTFKKYAKHMR